MTQLEATMNSKLIATLAALAIAAPLMGCAGETDAPEQQDGLKQEAQSDSNKDDQKTAEEKAEQEKLRQAEPGDSCPGNSGAIGENPCGPCGCFPY